MYRLIGQPELLKEINRTRVFDILRTERRISRPQLARMTGLSRATIALLVADLREAALLREVGLGDSSGGRPPVLLDYHPDAAFALGARMHDLQWRVVLTDLDGTILHRTDADIPDPSPASAVEALGSAVDRLLVGVDRTRVLPAIGIGAPGLVDIRSGVIQSAVDLGWFDVPIRSLVEQRTGLTAFVANRSKAGALAEYWHGTASRMAGTGNRVRDLIYIAIGTGVSAGIIHEGTIYLGSNSSAGELGHVTVEPDGPLCPCGNRGCLQQLVSEQAIAARALERLRRSGDGLLQQIAGNRPERITAKDVLEAAERGDPAARNVVEETAGYLGIAVANLVNLFNPELIVLGGPVPEISPLLVSLVEEQVRRRAMAHPLSAVRIATSSLGNDAAAVGAAVLVLQRLGDLFFRSRIPGSG